MNINIPLLATIPDNKKYLSSFNYAAFNPSANPPVLVSCVKTYLKFWQLSSETKSASCVSILSTTDNPKYPSYPDCIAVHPTADPPLLAAGLFGGNVELWRLSPDYTSANLVTTMRRNMGGTRYCLFYRVSPYSEPAASGNRW